MNDQTANILFVCTGNICRSPFAEALFTKLVLENGYQNLFAESAGLMALPGNSATALAQQVAAEQGVDLIHHQAKPVTEERVDGADLILVMEKSHEMTLLSFFPKATHKVRLIRHYARFGSKTRGIADPYGLNYDAYRFCFLDIEDAVKGLIEFLSE
ncbi:MAG: low molecular weight protein arginine phosphatase [Desulfobacterales bacterium]|nr:MAG: low molecular weight protein arginine phosphatase [Desulfobacterales bacterium]